MIRLLTLKGDSLHFCERCVCNEKLFVQETWIFNLGVTELEILEKIYSNTFGLRILYVRVNRVLKLHFFSLLSLE